MDVRLSRRSYCAAGLAAAVSLAGCASVRARERRLITSVRGSAGQERSWTLDLERNDRIIVEYRPDNDTPSVLTVTDANGNVVLETELVGQQDVRYDIEEAGTYTVHHQWGPRARVRLFVRS